MSCGSTALDHKVLTIATSMSKQAVVQKLYMMCHSYTAVRTSPIVQLQQGNHKHFDQGTCLSTENIVHVCACNTFLVGTSIAMVELQCQCIPHHKKK